MSSVHSVQLRSSPQLPPRGWPAFLTAPHLQQSWTGAPGAPLPCCRRSPQAPNAAPQRVLPVALVSLGITYNPRNVPWALHASAGVGQGTVAQVERDAAWDQRLEELRLFKEGTGGVAHVSQGDPERMALGEWCMTQRKTEKLGRLRADRKTRLLEIGFVFDLQEVAWQQSFEELRLFAKANEGVSHVSHSDPERPELGTWCRKQRTQEKRGSLRADRKARLLEIGFDFDRQEVAWNQRLEELRLVAEGNGGVAHVHQRDPERPELGRWCDNQIGFVFDPLEAAWEQSFEELRMVAAGNGGVAHVSQSDPERPALGRWCHWQIGVLVPQDREINLAVD
ncbi:hypothetical protein T484DRAFT_1839932 [Baffinella frigidus]|nr:hypothetical protein T484DRAFT_1839932 [Cryptophyta sp. CCMP2293]